MPHSLVRSILCGAIVTFFSALGVFSLSAGSTVDVTAPTSGWTAILYPNNSPDPSNDQQTGTSEGDIVGNALHPSVYTAFGDAGTPSLTDGSFAFRIRLGGDLSPAGFKTAAFVGIDANADGAIDLFIGINNSGSADTIGIWNPGTGANTSPNTTTMVSTPLVSYTQTVGNYSWLPVNATIDPSVGTATDLDGGGQNDYFLTFSIPFADIKLQLAARGIAGIDQNSSFSYVVATATQANSLNQDLNGVGKNYDGAATWSSLGAVTNTASPASFIQVPEAGTGALLLLGLSSLIGMRRLFRVIS